MATRPSCSDPLFSSEHARAARHDGRIWACPRRAQRMRDVEVVDVEVVDVAHRRASEPVNTAWWLMNHSLRCNYSCGDSTRSSTRSSTERFAGPPFVRVLERDSMLALVAARSR